MVGVLKPSLHYYSRQVGAVLRAFSASGLWNLSDRRDNETRRGSGPRGDELARRAGGASTASPSQLPLLAKPWCDALASNAILPALAGGARFQTGIQEAS